MLFMYVFLKSKYHNLEKREKFHIYIYIYSRDWKYSMTWCFVKIFHGEKIINSKHMGTNSFMSTGWWDPG